MVAARFAGARTGARTAARRRHKQLSSNQWNTSEQCTPRSCPSSSSLQQRAAREVPDRYLWRFGFGHDGPDPQFEVSIEGHREEDGHTMYILACSLCKDVLVMEPDVEPNEIAWVSNVRLCSLREELHDRVKEALGPVYHIHFNETPFAHHGGLPGTTMRLKRWLATLAKCMNEAILSPPLAAEVLRFFQAPVPKDSDSALLQAMGRCQVCTLPIEALTDEYCQRCKINSERVGVPAKELAANTLWGEGQHNNDNFMDVPPRSLVLADLAG